MINREDIIEIGKFQKTHALKGELNALLDIEEDYLTEGNPLIVEIDGIFVPFYSEGVRPKGATTFLIKLQGIDSIEEAVKFVNKPIYGRREDMLNYFDAEEGDLALPDDFIGYDVIDSENGYLGTLKRIDDSTMNTLMIVDDGPFGELYIPFNEDFIEVLDNEDKEIHTNLPDGLIDMNK